MNICLCFGKANNMTKRTPNLITFFEINDSFILYVYKGSLSKYDILLKYKQKIKNNWSRIRTPKHIHWAVDILMKMQGNKKLVKDFLNYMLKLWQRIKPLKSIKAQSFIKIYFQFYLLLHFPEEIKLKRCLLWY